jgi:hypothetical protein
MTLTKWLCRIYDDKKKGYVTLGDFLGWNILYILIIVFILGTFYSIYSFFVAGAFWAARALTTQPSLFYVVGAMIVVLISAILITLTIFGIIILIGELLSLIGKLLSVKIVKCEREQK